MYHEEKIKKKLTLKKETIANLNSDEMKDLKGGYPTEPLGCPTWNFTCVPPAVPPPPNCCDYGCCETIGCGYGMNP